MTAIISVVVDGRAQRRAALSSADRHHDRPVDLGVKAHPLPQAARSLRHLAGGDRSSTSIQPVAVTPESTRRIPLHASAGHALLALPMATTTTTIIGFDAATQPRNIGLARGLREGDRVRLTELRAPRSAKDLLDTLVSWCGTAALLAIDAPLGWPRPLGQGLHAHQAGQRLGGDGGSLFSRRTDRRVHAELRKKPLEIGADRIARTAQVTLAHLDDLRARLGQEIPLLWSAAHPGVGAIEVYPAATLLSRGVACNGYKGDEGAGRRRAIVDEIGHLFDRTPAAAIDAMVASDHLLDAALCVLAGADFLAGAACPPGEDEREDARVEGWIWFRRRGETPRS